MLGHQQIKKKYSEQFKLYREAVKRCYWLYSTHSDKFVITYKGEDNGLGVYVRTKQGGWFGIGDFWDSATLDVTGEIWDDLVKNIDDFSYSQEEKETLIKENTI